VVKREREWLGKGYKECTVGLRLACSRLRDSGEKSFSKKICEKRAGAGERIKLAAKTVDEDPASCKCWISRKEIKSAKI